MNEAIQKKTDANAATGRTQVARLSYLRIAPRKVRSIANIVRGLPVNEAEAQLMIQPRRASDPILKLLRSAVANAKNTKQMNPQNLFVAQIWVDQGPILKRYMPRARGSASPIQKKMSHATLVLGESLAARNSRFTITVKKRVKKERTEKGKAPERKPEAPRAAAPAPQKAGFFKKIFRRKSV